MGLALSRATARLYGSLGGLSPSAIRAFGALHATHLRGMVRLEPQNFAALRLAGRAIAFGDTALLFLTYI